MPSSLPSAAVLAQIPVLLAQGYSFREAGRALGVSPNTVRKYRAGPPAAGKGRVRFSPEAEASLSETVNAAQMPSPVECGGGPAMPEPFPDHAPHVVYDAPGKWLVVGDFHVPFHSPEAIRAAVDDGKRFGVTGVLINGDMLDFYGLSTHYREPDKVRIKEELEKGRELLRWLRYQFPHATICYRLGNHDERLRKTLAGRLPELFGIEEFHLSNLLKTADVGVQVVEDKRVVMLGKLPTIHGHEYKGGGGTHTARWLYLRTGESALTNHFHRVDHYTFRTITDREVGVWSVGCLCNLAPEYLRLNQWSHGWALCEVFQGGYFAVTNRQRLHDGRVV